MKNWNKHSNIVNSMPKEKSNSVLSKRWIQSKFDVHKFSNSFYPNSRGANEETKHVNITEKFWKTIAWNTVCDKHNYDIISHKWKLQLNSSLENTMVFLVFINQCVNTQITTVNICNTLLLLDIRFPCP